MGIVAAAMMDAQGTDAVATSYTLFRVLRSDEKNMFRNFENDFGRFHYSRESKT